MLVDIDQAHVLVLGSLVHARVYVVGHTLVLAAILLHVGLLAFKALGVDHERVGNLVAIGIGRCAALDVVHKDGQLVGSGRNVLRQWQQ